MGNQVNDVGIIGTGMYLPQRVLNNLDLEKMVDTSDEWIVQRTGISERRLIEDSMPAYKMGVEAGRMAIENAGLTSEDIDLIIATTFAPDYYSPAMASLIQKDLGAKKAAAFDINAACTGFVYGLTVAEQFVKTGFYKNVLLVSCEANSRVVDFKDRNTCILFGDGAGAAVVSQVPEGYGILSQVIFSDGEGGDVITVPSTFLSEQDRLKRPNQNKRVISLDGSEVMKFAVRSMVSSVQAVLEKGGMEVHDVDLLIPHQANIRIIEGATKRLNIQDEKVFKNMQKYGNMSSASIPIAICEAVQEERLKDGDHLVLVGFGGGLTWGANLLKWHSKS
jgi:3-oxoacyl-[acyl-carrier-protein] synthase III